MSLRSQHTSEVKHGSTRDVVDGSTSCVEAVVYIVASRCDTSDPWDDVMVLSEQPRRGQLRRDDGSGGIYELSGYHPSDDDDDAGWRLLCRGLAEEQQRQATLVGEIYIAEKAKNGCTYATTINGREHSAGYKPLYASTPGDDYCSDEMTEAQVSK